MTLLRRFYRATTLAGMARTARVLGWLLGKLSPQSKAADDVYCALAVSAMVRAVGHAHKQADEMVTIDDSDGLAAWRVHGVSEGEVN